MKIHSLFSIIAYIALSTSALHALESSRQNTIPTRKHHLIEALSKLTGSAAQFGLAGLCWGMGADVRVPYVPEKLSLAGLFIGGSVGVYEFAKLGISGCLSLKHALQPTSQEETFKPFGTEEFSESVIATYQKIKQVILKNRDTEDIKKYASYHDKNKAKHTVESVIHSTLALGSLCGLIFAGALTTHMTMEAVSGKKASNALIPTLMACLTLPAGYNVYNHANKAIQSYKKATAQKSP